MFNIVKLSNLIVPKALPNKAAAEQFANNTEGVAIVKVGVNLDKYQVVQISNMLLGLSVDSRAECEMHLRRYRDRYVNSSFVLVETDVAQTCDLPTGALR